MATAREIVTPIEGGPFFFEVAPPASNLHDCHWTIDATRDGACYWHVERPEAHLAAEVPIPGPIWLMASVVIGFLLMKRRA